MNRPLFAVGEVVILVCEGITELNGEYKVAHIVISGDVYQGFVVGEHDEGFGYDLGLDHPLGGSRIFAEKSLRKRHQPGEYSFDALKQILALPVSREDFV